MQPIYIVVILTAIIALGEVLSLSTRAKVPTLLVVVAVTFLLLQTGILPESYIEKSTFLAAGSVLVPVLIVHLGTLIPMSVMKAQYKAVLITLIGLFISVVVMLTLITLFFDYSTAVAGAGPLTGGIIAYIVTAEGLTDAGFTTLAAIPVVVFALQNLVGMPLTSTLLSKYAISIRDDISFQEAAATSESGNPLEAGDGKKLLLPEKFMQSHFFILFLLFIGGALAKWLGDLTGINYSLWSLAIGLVAAATGILPPRALDRSNSTGLAMVTLIIVVISSLVGITWDQVVQSIVPVIAVIVIGTSGLILGGYIGGKLFKWKATKSIPVVLTAMYGFPGDYLIVEEVSRSTGRNDKERQRIMDELVAPMLIGGFTSVTVGSILIASILLSTL